jgi:hypothetical protein
MKRWFFFHKQTGQFAEKSFSSRYASDVELNTPEGHGSIAGQFDHLSQRVDIATSEVVDYQPPQPSSEHEWNTETKRWQLTAEAQQRNADHASAQATIARLESQQARSIRELFVDSTNAEARNRLTDIDQQIAALRPAL